MMMTIRRGAIWRYVLYVFVACLLVLTFSSCVGQSTNTITINLGVAWFWWKISGVAWLVLAFLGFVFFINAHAERGLLGFVPVVIFVIWLITVLIRGLFW